MSFELISSFNLIWLFLFIIKSNWFYTWSHFCLFSFKLKTCPIPSELTEDGVTESAELWNIPVVGFAELEEAVTLTLWVTVVSSASIFFTVDVFSRIMKLTITKRIISEKLFLDNRLEWLGVDDRLSSAKDRIYEDRPIGKLKYSDLNYPILFHWCRSLCRTDPSGGWWTDRRQFDWIGAWTIYVRDLFVLVRSFLFVRIWILNFLLRINFKSRNIWCQWNVLVGQWNIRSISGDVIGAWNIWTRCLNSISTSAEFIFDNINTLKWLVRNF